MRLPAPEVTEAITNHEMKISMVSSYSEKNLKICFSVQKTAESERHQLVAMKHALKVLTVPIWSAY